MDHTRFVELMRALHTHDVEYVLFGAAAMGMHGVVRATEDVDLFLRPAIDNVDRLKRAFRLVWNDPCIDEISAEELVGDYPALRYGPPDDALYVDVVTRLGEAFGYDDLECDVIHLGEIPVRTASVRTLVRMKRDTVRAKDRLDVEALRERFGEGIE